MTEFFLQELAAAAIRHRYRSTSWWQLIIVIAIGYGIRWLIVNAGSKARTQNPVRTFLRTGLGDSKKNFWGAERQQNSVNGFDPKAAENILIRNFSSDPLSFRSWRRFLSLWRDMPSHMRARIRPKFIIPMLITRQKY